jgi:hypothetical protein
MIKWQTYNVAKVKIEYSTDDGGHWSDIFPEVSALQDSCSWEIPYTISRKCRIRISDISNLSISDTSDSLFEISDNQRNALYFSGKTQVQIPNTSLEALFTAEFWIRFHNVDNLGIPESYSRWSRTLLIAGSDSVLFLLYPRTVIRMAMKGVNEVISSSLTFENNRWYHIAAVKTNLLRKMIFLDGKIIADGPSESSGSTSSNIFLMPWKSDINQNIKTDVDELRIWNTPLSQGEIEQNKYKEINHHENLYGVWHFDENDGQIVIDSANGHNGYLGVDSVVDDKDPVRIKTDSPMTPFRLAIPNGGESLTAGASQRIYWYIGGSENINIEYSADHGQVWASIASQIDAAAGEYLWTVPSINSSNCLVRITDPQSGRADQTDSTFAITSPIAVEDASPLEFRVFQNTPNPFNPTTHIAFSLPKASHATLSVYNTTGQKVATLLDRRMEAGKHSAVWNGTGCSTGLYFYKLEADGKAEIRKMLLLK